MKSRIRQKRKTDEIFILLDRDAVFQNSRPPATCHPDASLGTITPMVANLLRTLEKRADISLVVEFRFCVVRFFDDSALFSHILYYCWQVSSFCTLRSCR